MADEDLGTATITIELDDNGVESSLTRLSDRIERALDEAARDGGRRMARQISAAIAKINPVKLEITADTRRFQTALNRLNNLGSSEITVVPGVDPVRFRRQLQRLVRGITVRIQIEPDFTGFDDTVRAHRAPPIEVDVEANVDRDRLGRAFGSLGKALGSVAGIAKMTLALGALGIAATSAAAAIGGLVSALAPAAGIVAAAPALILGYQAALGALKIALSGVSDAFGAALTGDAEEFSKAIESLSPRAREAAQEIRAMKPAFDRLKSTVQDNFFAQITGQITATAKALEGPVTRGLAAISGQWGLAARNVLGYVQGTKGVANVQSILTATTQSVEGLSRTTNQLTAGLLQAAATISDAYGEKFAGGIEVIGQRFGRFLQTTAGDGRLVQWVDGALDVLAKLGDILGNIGGIFSGLQTAATNAGGGILTNIQRTTQAFEDFVKSVEGQEALVNIFRTIAAVASQLGPIFIALVQAVGAVVPALAPLLTTIGPAITGVIQALLPAIQALLPGITAVVNAIVTGLGEITASGVLADIGKALGGILTAVAPLLPVIGQLVASLGQALAPVVAALAEALTPVITAIAGALTPILPPLVDVVLQLVDAFAPLVAIIGSSLAKVITALSPILITVAQALGTLAEAVAPLIVQLVDGLAPIIEQIAPIVTRLVTAIAPLITQLVAALLPVLPPLIDAFLAILEAVTPLIEPIVQLVESLAPLVALIISGLAPIIQFAAELIKWVSLNAVVPIIEGIVAVLSGLITALGDIIDGVVFFVDSVVGFFTDLDDNVTEIVGGLVDDTKAFFTDMKDRAVEKVAALVADAVRFLQALPGRAKGALSSLGTSIGQAVASAALDFLGRIRNLVTDAVNLVRDLPGKAKSALGSLGSTLYSAGQDLIQGMINGVRDMAGNIASAAKDVVKGAVDSAKDFLGIQSPSKVFYGIGTDTGQGLVNGIDAMGAAVSSAASNLAADTLNPFTSLGAVPASVSPVNGLGNPFRSQGTLAPVQALTGLAGASRETTVNNNIVINEVGNGEATAQRVVNRLALTAGLL